MHLQKEHGVRHQRLVEDAQKNHKVAVKLLKASLGRCVFCHRLILPVCPRRNLGM